MDFAYRIRHLPFRFGLPVRIPGVQTITRFKVPERFKGAKWSQPGVTRRFIKNATGPILLVLAIAFGRAAFLATESSTLRDWNRKHGPSPALWRAILESKGWGRLSDPELIQRASRSIPTRLDEPGAAWMTPDRNWIAVFGLESDTLPATLHCRECARKPDSWQPIQSGWEAFESFVKQLETWPARPAKAKPRAFKIPADPREVRY